MLIGDSARAAMLFALLDGGRLPASELASRANVSRPSASAHLQKLVGAGLIEVRPAGRMREFRLASRDVGRALEALANISRPARVASLSQTTTMQRMREARTCYDHLAGRLGVAVTDALVGHGALELVADIFTATKQSARIFRKLEIDLREAHAQRRSFAPSCIDWTERRLHVAGALGAAILERFLSERWIIRNSRDRAVRITPAGRAALAHHFSITIP